jgi:endonuclease IV
MKTIPRPDLGEASPRATRTQKNQRLVGVHLSTTGGVAAAVRRAPAIGANTLQIFSSSPRMWRASNITAAQAEDTRAARAEMNIRTCISRRD